MSGLFNALNRLTTANRVAIVSAAVWIMLAAFVGWHTLLEHRRLGGPEPTPGIFVLLTVPFGVAGLITTSAQLCVLSRLFHSLPHSLEATAADQDERRWLAENRTWAIWLLFANLLPLLVLCLAIAFRR